MTSVLQPMDQGVIEITRKLYRKSLLRRILLSYETGKGYEVDLLGAVHLIEHSWKQVMSVSIASCFRHAGFSRTPSPPETQATPEFNDCDELCEEVRRLTGCADNEVDGDVNFEEYALYERDVPVTGDMTDAEVIQAALGNVDDEEEGDEPPREIPTSAETRNLLRLLRNKVECSGGEERLMRSLKVLEDALLAPNVNAKQTDIATFFSAQ